MTLAMSRARVKTNPGSTWDDNKAKAIRGQISRLILARSAIAAEPLAHSR